MATLDLARSLMHTGRYEQALRELETCGSMSPDVELDKGMCYAALGRMSRARGVLDGLRLSGFDRHADRLSRRIDADEPMAPAAGTVELEPPERRSRKLAMMYVVFAALGALLLLEGVYVGAGLVSGGAGKPPTPPVNAIAPVPAQGVEMGGPDETGIRTIDLGFAVDTTSLQGNWQSVDFVQNIDDFSPGQKQSRENLYVREMSFADNGTTAMNGQPSGIAWETGWITFKGDHVKAQYAVRTIDGAAYLFLPWLNGDVTVGGMRPNFYVLQKTD